MESGLYWWAVITALRNEVVNIYCSRCKNDVHAGTLQVREAYAAAKTRRGEGLLLQLLSVADRRASGRDHSTADRSEVASREDAENSAPPLARPSSAGPKRTCASIAATRGRRDQPSSLGARRLFGGGEMNEAVAFVVGRAAEHAVAFDVMPPRRRGDPCRW